MTDPQQLAFNFMKDYKDNKEEQQQASAPIEVQKANPVALSAQQDVMPATLKTSAETSMQLRDVQIRLANLVTDDNYISLIAATNPEVLPQLLDSVTNGIATADNLLIRMAQVSEKSASMQRVFDYLTKKQEAQNKDTAGTVKDEYYDESVEKIKKAIYRQLDEDRDKHKATAQDYINEEADIIDAEVVETDNDRD